MLSVYGEKSWKKYPVDVSALHDQSHNTVFYLLYYYLLLYLIYKYYFIIAELNVVQVF